MSQTNTALTGQESGWVSEFAGRLRAIQADSASMPTEKRREVLQEELERGLKSVPAANRKRCIEALVERFPVLSDFLKAEPAAPKVIVKEPPPETPSQTLERFLAAQAALPEDQRAALVRRLQEAKMVPAAPAGPGPAVLEVSSDAQKMLGLAAGQQPRLEQLARLTAQLVETFCALDQVALKTLGQLSTRSAALKRPEDFRSTARRYLTGETDSVETQIRALTSLLGALMAATLAGGKDFGRQHVERFSPAAIEDVVAAEGSSGIFGPKPKERCWDKYTELSKDYATPDLIDRRIKDCLAAFVEKWKK